MTMPSISITYGTTLFYKDWGRGKPLVFAHGWPLDADAWDAQMLFLGQQGYRVIAHDRRGHGRSDQTWDGNDMDTYADDVAALFEARSSRCHLHRPLNRRRRGGSLPRQAWHLTRFKSGAHERSAAGHVEKRE